jgi:hypothetical protein
MRNLMRNALVAVLLAGFFSACGSSHEGSGQSGNAAHTSRKGEAKGANMVSAVTQTKPGTAPQPVQVKFALRARPTPSQPLDVTVQIIPTASNLDRISGRVEGDEGLEMVGSGELAEAEKPVENTPIERSIQVLPKQDGIYTLTATVTVEMGGQNSTQAYQFPVISGTGLPDLPAPAKPGAPAPATASAASTSAPAAR